MAPDTFRISCRSLSLLLALSIIPTRLIEELTIGNVPSELTPARSIDSETAIASGHRLPLDSLDMYGLELIPGISDGLAKKILRSKRSIADTAAWLRKERRQRAFEVVDGIGPRTATILSSLIDPVTTTRDLRSCPSGAFCPLEIRPGSPNPFPDRGFQLPFGQ